MIQSRRAKLPPVENMSYDRPPITEAVIGVNFSEPLEQDLIAKANEKFLKHYPQHQPVQNFNVKVALRDDGYANADGTKVNRGHRRTNPDINELLVLWCSSFTVSQLAPYPGWDEFFARFVRDWRIWKRAVGYREISRIGVRFINRIDIPVRDDIVKYENYLNVYPKLPEILDLVGQYAVQAVIPLDDIESVLTLNSALVSSPILEHCSFLIDLDIAKDVECPQKEQDMFAFLNQVRNKKNEVFEACISNEARKLFKK